MVMYCKLANSNGDELIEYKSVINKSKIIEIYAQNCVEADYQNVAWDELTSLQYIEVSGGVFGPFTYPANGFPNLEKIVFRNVNPIDSDTIIDILEDERTTRLGAIEYTSQCQFTDPTHRYANLAAFMKESGMSLNPLTRFPTSPEIELSNNGKRSSGTTSEDDNSVNSQDDEDELEVEFQSASDEEEQYEDTASHSSANSSVLGGVRNDRLSSGKHSDNQSVMSEISFSEYEQAHERTSQENTVEIICKYKDGYEERYDLDTFNDIDSSVRANISQIEIKGNGENIIGDIVFSNLSNLEHLEIKNAELIGSDVKTRSSSLSMPKLTSLVIENCSIDTDGMGFFINTNLDPDEDVVQAIVLKDIFDIEGNKFTQAEAQKLIIEGNKFTQAEAQKLINTEYYGNPQSDTSYLVYDEIPEEDEDYEQEGFEDDSTQASTTTFMKVGVGPQLNPDHDPDNKSRVSAESKASLLSGKKKDNASETLELESVTSADWEKFGQKISRQSPEDLKKTKQEKRTRQIRQSDLESINSENRVRAFSEDSDGNVTSNPRKGYQQIGSDDEQSQAESTLSEKNLFKHNAKGSKHSVIESWAKGGGGNDYGTFNHPKPPHSSADSKADPLARGQGRTTHLEDPTAKLKTMATAIKKDADYGAAAGMRHRAERRRENDATIQNLAKRLQKKRYVEAAKHMAARDSKKTIEEWRKEEYDERASARKSDDEQFDDLYGGFDEASQSSRHEGYSRPNKRGSQEAPNYSMFSHGDYRIRYSEQVPATTIMANGREEVRDLGKIEEDIHAGLDEYVNSTERPNYRTEQDASNDSVDLYCKEKRALTAKSESITVYKHWANSSKRDYNQKALIILKSLGIPPSFPKEGIYVEKGENTPLGKAVYAQYDQLKAEYTANQDIDDDVALNVSLPKGKGRR